MGQMEVDLTCYSCSLYCEGRVVKDEAKVRLDSCGKCIKIVFVLLIALYMLMGLALIGVGSQLVHTGLSIDFFTDNEFFSGAALIIICGVFIFIITPLGIVATPLKIRVLLVAYILIIITVVILEVVAVISRLPHRSALVAGITSDHTFSPVGNNTLENKAELGMKNDVATDYF